MFSSFLIIIISKYGYFTKKNCIFADDSQSCCLLTGLIIRLQANKIIKQKNKPKKDETNSNYRPYGH